MRPITSCHWGKISTQLSEPNSEFFATFCIKMYETLLKPNPFYSMMALGLDVPLTQITQTGYHKALDESNRPGLQCNSRHYLIVQRRRDTDG